MTKKSLYNLFILLIFISQFILINLQEDDPEDTTSVIDATVTDLKLKKTNSISYYLSDIEKNGVYSYTSTYNDNYHYQISYADKQYVSNGNTKFPQVKISDDCLGKLKSDDEDEIFLIAKIFRKVQNHLNTLAGITDIADIIYYEFFYINTNNNTIRDGINILSTCNGEKVTYYLPIYSEDDSLKNKYVSVSGQNPSEDIEDLRDYDIFDPNAKIYDDICARITFSVASENVVDQDSFENYDITLKERRKYYFPGNTALCPNRFTYLGVDRNSFSSMCKTDFKLYDDTVNKYDLHNDYTSFEFDGDDFNNTKGDIYFTMNVLKCIKLPFTKKGFRGNYGNYFMLVLIAIIIVCYLILLLSGKYHLLSVLELLYNSNIKSMNYLKGASNNPLTNNSNQVIPYDIRSNNNLGMSHQTITSNGQLLSNALTGNNFLYYNPNVDKISISKKSSSINNNLKKNEKEKEKKSLMSNVDEQEHDFESEKGNEEKDKTKRKKKFNEQC